MCAVRAPGLFRSVLQVELAYGGTVGFTSCKYLAAVRITSGFIPIQVYSLCRSYSSDTNVFKSYISAFSRVCSIIAFADRAEREPERLNIFLENAGMVIWEYERVEGWKRTSQHSVIPRLVIVASDMHYWKTVDTLIPNIRNMLDILIARSLQLHVPASPAITAYSVNLGFFCVGLRTGIPAEEAEAMRKEEDLYFAPEAERRQLVYTAVGTLDDEERLRGKCIQMSEVVEESGFVISKGVKIVQDKFGERCWIFWLKLISRSRTWRKCILIDVLGTKKDIDARLELRTITGNKWKNRTWHLHERSEHGANGEIRN
ncbi:hypothetical protein EDD85DRAFT_940154 [Armillaria nabsnona]|nr:hypothetical protein EDD85DRAFT_940154 [Armillaria nabsnona]